MRFKIQFDDNGVIREIFINSAKDLIAVKFTQAELNMLSQWPSADHPLVMGPKRFIVANPDLVNKFVNEWPLEFFSGTHTAPTGSVIGPDGRLLDKKGH